MALDMTNGEEEVTHPIKVRVCEFQAGNYEMEHHLIFVLLALPVRKMNSEF